MGAKNINIEYLPLSKIKMYEKNPRKNEDAVEYVANSIKEFGFKVPIVLDKDGVIVTGHTRYKASKQLGLKKVPCIVADDLTDEQIKAFRLADNKVSEQAEWDLNLLDEELGEIINFDMEEFGFDIDGLAEDLEDAEQAHQQAKEATQISKANILNLEVAQYEYGGKYDIPALSPISMTEIGEIKEWIPFNYVLSDKEPEGKGVHFFVDDYQFVRVWNDPMKYIEKLKQYKAVMAPDFSPYGDMPLATQIFNHYRKHWCARYWQENGINVIPVIRASTDERSLEWYLEGEPENSVVCISNMWTSDTIGKTYFLEKEYKNMIEKLHPEHVLVYGHEMEELKDVTYIKSFSESRYRNG